MKQMTFKFHLMQVARPQLPPRNVSLREVKVDVLLTEHRRRVVEALSEPQGATALNWPSVVVLEISYQSHVLWPLKNTFWYSWCELVTVVTLANDRSSSKF